MSEQSRAVIPRACTEVVLINREGTWERQGSFGHIPVRAQHVASLRLWGK